MVRHFEENGVAKHNLIVSIPATEQGVHATRLLAKEDGILVNSAMVAGMSHAAVCAEAGAAWITFHLDRVGFFISHCNCHLLNSCFVTVT